MKKDYKYLFSFFYQVDLQKMLWFLMQKKFRYNFCMYCDVFRQIRVQGGRYGECGQKHPGKLS